MTPSQTPTQFTLFLSVKFHPATMNPGSTPHSGSRSAPNYPTPSSSRNPNAQHTNPRPPRNIVLPPVGLLTPMSHFPSRILPPPGSKSLDLDQDITLQTFQPGQQVRVRRFLGETKGWTPWKDAIVIKHEPIISYAGARGNGYLVRELADDGSRYVQMSYAAFYAEICSADSTAYPEVDPRFCAQRRKQSDMVYAKLPDLNTDPRIIIWSPARVIHWKPGQSAAKVMSMENQTSGRMFDVSEILSFTPETANACRSQGHYVLELKGNM